ncbi:HAD superfamily hydrolase [Spiroplasma chinense]|uniref:HAD superfamily hydrolase n=1 Tax=Spiroplasma chinense TaxID=216932 RepID=A0A5B9Y2W9_9MOLU|nr:Cof-type HAD-IIB family hydrolase [Spiroplasma chinense]QEH61390.1 HAD superfamily hydrolase [Spiroplasma chinense]
MKNNLKENVVIFSDLDGTALASNHDYSDLTLETVKKVYESGHYFIPITARSTKDAVFQQGIKLGMDKMGGIVIANNGTHIYDFKEEKFIRALYISNEMLKKIFDETYGKIGKYKVHYFSDQTTYVYGYGENSKYWSDVMQMEYKKIDSFEDIHEPVNHLTIILAENADDKTREEFYKEFEFVKDELSIIQYTERVFELSTKGINKGEALTATLKHLGLNEQNTSVFCFGDGVNDVQMFEQAEHPIAMQNAIDEVKKVAQEVTLSNDENGVARFILDNIL